MAEHMVEGKVENSPAKPKKKYNYKVHRECKHSHSCFECPLADCEAKISNFRYLNMLPTDDYRYRQARRFRLYS